MLEILLETAHSGYDRKTCFVHARAAAIPGTPPSVVMTMHPLRLTGCDVFYSVHDLRTDDGGKTWTGPAEHADTLGRRPCADADEEGFINPYPQWHQGTGVVLCIGDSIGYKDDALMPQPRPVKPGYTVYDAAARTWSPWKKLQLPDPDKFYETYSGSTQRIDLPNGEILLPAAFCLPRTAGDPATPHVEHGGGVQEVAIVMRCTFDGRTLRYVEHGTELTVPEARGFCEPSLAYAGDRYFLTLRNDLAGYVTSGTDGLHFAQPRRWTFDDGSDLGNYNTQQHWVTHGDDLCLVYTRRGADNDHVVRHRAPLFIAQVDKDRLCVIRETEQILVPERGARLGNFGVTKIGEHETWVTAAEWMQGRLPDWWNPLHCERHGSDNSIFVARILFDA